jgi:hypothetical protein
LAQAHRNHFAQLRSRSRLSQTGSPPKTKRPTARKESRNLPGSGPPDGGTYPPTHELRQL